MMSTMSTGQIKGSRKLGEIDNIFYVLGLIAIGIALLFTAVYLFTGWSVLNIKFPCVFKSVTGLWCPGCGGTRSVRALLRGDMWQSFIDYPPVLYGIVVYAEFMVRAFLRKHFSTENRSFGPEKDGAIIPYIYVGIGLMFLQWIIKLIAQVGFGVSWIK